MTDDQRSKNRRNWRGFTWDYARIEEQETLSPTLHCLSATTRMLVLSMLEMIGWSTRYSVPYGESIDSNKIQAWEAIAAYELSEGQMLRGVGCTLEISCDGVNWTTLIDFSECMAHSTINNNSTVIYETEMEQLNEDWDGTPESIDAEFTEYNGAGNDWRDTALCMALKLYVEAISGVWKAKEGTSSSRPFLMSLALSVIGSGAMAFVSGTIANLIAGVLGEALSISSEDIDIDCADADVIDQVVCCAYDALNGQTSSSQSFNEAFDDCDFDEGSCAARLASVCAIASSFNAYMAFLKLWNEAYTYAKNDLIENECLACGRWSKYWDFREGIPHDWIVSIGFNNDTFGELGSTGFDSNVGNTVSGVSIGFDMAIPVSSTLRHMKMEYDYQDGGHWDSAGNNQTNLRINNLNPGKQILGNISSLIDNSGVDKELIWNGSKMLTPTSWLNAQVVCSVDYDNQEFGSGKILGVYVEGEGTPPSWAD